MTELVTRDWWMPFLRGLFAMGFGVVAALWPGLTVLALVLVFGAYALVDGVFILVAAFGGGVRGRSRTWLACCGAGGIAVGVLTMFWPGVTGLGLLLLIAAWALVTGVSEAAAAVSLRAEMPGQWGWGVASGAASALFGIVLLTRPESGALAVGWLIGLFSIVLGMMLVAAGLRLRGQYVPERDGRRIRQQVI